MASTDLYPDRPRTNEESPPLNLGGQLLVGLIFAAGVALLIVGGLYGGAIIGVIRGSEVMNNTPTRNIGMAPDLEPVVKGAFTFGGWALVGAGIGLVAGVAIMWAACGYLVAPLLRTFTCLRR